MNKHFVFAKEKFPEFFKSLQSFGTVNAPVRVSNQSFSFKPVEASADIAFEALRTILPPKKFFYRTSEILFRYNGSSIEEARPEPAKLVLFGVHPCDMAGLAVMDTIFMAGPGDTHYQARRENVLIIGLSCMPDKHCFCKSMGTDQPGKGYDLFLTDIAEKYFVQVSTPAGLEVLKRFALAEDANDQDASRYKHFWAERDKAFRDVFDVKAVPAIMDLEQDNEIWDELGNRCLSCGNCVPVCPTCYCFDIVDHVELNGDSGQRVREWDSCQTVGFAKVAGDFNFRPGPVDRLKFWYRHKLHGFDDAAAIPTCVGCGRCTVSCPSGIDDLIGVVLRLQGDSVSLNLPEKKADE